MNHDPAEHLDRGYGNGSLRASETRRQLAHQQASKSARARMPGGREGGGGVWEALETAIPQKAAGEDWLFKSMHFLSMPQAQEKP